MRVPIGGYLTGGAIWHSQCGESIFAHVPGLLIAFPSRARDAAGLLRYAFRCEDPVLFLEHKHLLRQPYTVDAFPPRRLRDPVRRGRRAPAGRRPHDRVVGRHRREVAAGGGAGRPSGTGFEVEVVDLRTISPWDRDLVAESVARTHRLLVVHEDVLTAGFGAEVAAWAASTASPSSTRRCAGWRPSTPTWPTSPTLEDAILPQVDDIHAAVVDLCAF